MSEIASIPYVGWVIPFLIVLGVVVFIHEYGHYIVGRWCGIKAENFSVGFGKELFGWNDKRGMRWSIRALPLGGFVKFAGDANAASAGSDKDALAAMTPEEKRRTLTYAPIWARMLTIVAGPGANFILSILVFTAMAMIAGRAVNEPVIGTISPDAPANIGFQAGDRVVAVDGKYVKDYNELMSALDDVAGQDVTAVVNRGRGEEEIAVYYIRPAQVDQVIPGGAAADAGLEVGDVVTHINGDLVPTFEALRDVVVASNGDPLDLTVMRGGETVAITLTPNMVDVADPETGEMTKRPMIGVRNRSFGGVEPQVEAANPIDALDYGVERTWLIITGTLNFVKEMVAGRADTSQLGGPIQIAKVSGQAAKQGIESLALMIALISTSIGLINLFPIPVLDGGHLVFYTIEALRGRPLRERWQEIGNGLGFGLIILLMVFATYNDLIR